ncbi:PREDICTED: ATPase WRNIP1-like [Branchiostoma belcheri]|uniref:ATPase WRNIP1-like n=1 Tax=Branchiostoma belcheri TaxID=7741 RepID=A0A6P4YID4_BRABE|nr:PREDICTED: ATPase WRNIP1-like [Branchiostoma belcheri]
MAARRTDLLPCPICGKTYSTATINSHVDRCLKEGEESQGHPEPGMKRPGDEKVPPAKRSKQESSTGSRGGQACLGSPTAKPPAKGRVFSSPVSAQTSTFFQKRGATTSSENSVQNGDKSKATKEDFRPLAERVRPASLDQYVGQTKALGAGSMLRLLVEAHDIPSMVLWGPPGCGKTTMARIIAKNAKQRQNSRFVSLSATMSGVDEVRDVIKVAKNEQTMFRRKTILFIDEIHRFNKKQQDTFLPHVESGAIVLIGATTENPSFSLNSALLSRCRVIVLEKLEVEDVELILRRAARTIGVCVSGEESEVDSDKEAEEPRTGPPVTIQKEAITTLAHLCDGDARTALNGLQTAVRSQTATHSNHGDTQPVVVTVEHVKEGLQRSHVLYDRAGEEHYNIISAMHKSIRGSDANAALYWLARMLAGGEDVLYNSLHLISGLADPSALVQAVATYQACHSIGMPECEVILAQCVVYLARASKSVEVYVAYTNAKQCVERHQGPLPGVPLHLRNAPTRLMKDLGYGKGYKYNPSYSGPVDQDYLPQELLGTDFFTYQGADASYM